MNSSNKTNNSNNNNNNNFTISNLLVTFDSPRDKSKELNEFNKLSINSTKKVLKLNSIEEQLIKLNLIESLSSLPINNLNQLKKIVKELDLLTFEELLEERHSQNYCAYPGCQSNQPSQQEYNPTTSSTSTSSSKKIKLKGGNLYGSLSLLGSSDTTTTTKTNSGAYCSKLCQHRSEWYRNMIGTNRTELLEEVELRRNQLGGVHTTTSSSELREEVEGEEEIEAVSISAPIDSPPTFIIKENPTPFSPPLAPSTKSTDFERLPSSSTTSTSNSNQSPLSLSRGTRTSSSRTTLIDESPSASLLPFSTKKLSNSLLQANKSLTPGSSSSSTASSTYYGSTKPSMTEPRFISEPIMVNEQGIEINWTVAEVGGKGGERAETEEEKNMMEEALEIRRLLRESGEVL